MSAYSDLDIHIRDYAKKHKKRYRNLYREINEHLHNRKDFDDLSEDAKNIVVEWERENLLRNDKEE